MSESGGPPLTDSVCQNLSASLGQPMSESGGHIAGVLAAVRRISVRATEHRTASPYGSFYLRLGTIC